MQNIFTVTGLRTGFILFILSEVSFFFRFFWTYFHRCWGPNNLTWPPYELQEIVVDPVGVPLLNTLLLVSSGVTITRFHADLITKDEINPINLIRTIFLGVLFLYCQILEYGERRFSFKRGSYGRAFFILTGFHGLHVTIGVVLLSVSLLRYLSQTLSILEHVGIEASIWYWHFVDVVWLFLFIFVYMIYGR